MHAALVMRKKHLQLKPAAMAGALALAFAAAPGPAGGAAMKSYADVSPKKTISLHTLEEKYDFISSAVRGKHITLRTKFNTINLEGDSRRMTFNGIAVWLNGPVSRRWGSWHILQADVDRTLLPLFNPNGALAAEDFRIVTLDPGHGGSDQGACSRSGLVEKKLTLDLAKKVRAILLRYRIDARLTRNADRQLELEDRTALANGWKSSVFVSLHFNSAGNTDPSGIETHILPPAGYPSTANNSLGVYDQVSYAANRHDRANIILGYTLQKSLLRHAGGEDRGVRRSRFVVLKSSASPACLVECGFLSNRSEAGDIATAAHMDKLARGIAEGILSYLNSVERARAANR